MCWVRNINPVKLLVVYLGGGDPNGKWIQYANLVRCRAYARPPHWQINQIERTLLQQYAGCSNVPHTNGPNFLQNWYNPLACQSSLSWFLQRESISTRHRLAFIDAVPKWLWINLLSDLTTDPSEQHISVSCSVYCERNVDRMNKSWDRMVIVFWLSFSIDHVGLVPRIRKARSWRSREKKPTQAAEKAQRILLCK